MPFRSEAARRLSALRVADHDAWFHLVRKTLILRMGNRSAAARELGVNPRTVGAWVRDEPALLDWHPDHPPRDQGAPAPLAPTGRSSSSGGAGP